MNRSLSLLPLSAAGRSAWQLMLERSGFLGPLLWEHVSSRPGTLFALAPSDSSIDQLDSPEAGGLVHADDESPEVALARHLLGSPWTSDERRGVFLEESGRDLNDPFLSTIRLDRTDSKVSALFWIEIDSCQPEAVRSRLLAALRDIGPFPIVCGFVAALPGQFCPMSDSTAINLLARADVVFTNGYDFESYLIWLPDRSRSG